MKEERHGILHEIRCDQWEEEARAHDSHNGDVEEDLWLGTEVAVPRHYVIKDNITEEDK